MHFRLSICIEHHGWNWLPDRLNLLGSKGWPLKGEPSAFQASLRASNCFYSSVVGNPICFLCCSYMILRIAPCVSSSKSVRGLVLLTLLVSISGSPLNTVFQIFSSAFSKFKTRKVFPPDFYIFQTDSPAFIFSYSSPSINTSPVFLPIDTFSFRRSTLI